MDDGRDWEAVVAARRETIAGRREDATARRREYLELVDDLPEGDGTKRRRVLADARRARQRYETGVWATREAELDAVAAVLESAAAELAARGIGPDREDEVVETVREEIRDALVAAGISPTASDWTGVDKLTAAAALGADEQHRPLVAALAGTTVDELESVRVGHRFGTGSPVPTDPGASGTGIEPLDCPHCGSPLVAAIGASERLVADPDSIDSFGPPDLLCPGCESAVYAIDDSEERGSRTNG